MLPASYTMKELASGKYADRTEQNVRDGDGTLIVSHGSLTGGSALTAKIARRLGKPFLHIDFKTCSTERAAHDVAAWITSRRIRVLNVAGPRASSDAGIYDKVRNLVADVIRMTR